MVITKPQVVSAYLAYVLCMASEVFSRVFAGGESSGGGKATFLHSENSNPILLCFTLVLVGWTLALAIPIYPRVLNRLVRVPWMTALYVEAAASLLWSAEPASTFRYGVYLWVYLLAGLICSLYLTTPQALTIVGNTVSLMALLSIAAQFHYAQHNAAPGWTGVYGEKNHLGISMVIGMIALAVPRERWTALRILKFALCLFLMLMSQSGTALVCLVFCGTLLLCLRTAPRLRQLLVVLFAGTFVIVYSLVPDLLEKMLALGGKDPTLTGRDVIWRFSLEQWLRKPVLGWGYSTFWSSQDALIQQHLGWNPTYSHNGFIEIALSLGIVGLVFISGLLVNSLYLAFQISRSSDELTGTWLLLSFAILILHDMTEVDFLICAPLWIVFGLSFFNAVDVQIEAAERPARALSFRSPLGLAGILTGQEHG